MSGLLSSIITASFGWAFLNEELMLSTSANILLVSANDSLVGAIRDVLRKLEYQNSFHSPSYSTAIRRMLEQDFDMVIFDLARSDMMGRDFVRNLSSFADTCFRVGMTDNPELKVVLDLLEVGTHGFLIHPFTEESVKEVFDLIEEAPKFNEAIFDKINRIATFKALLLANLNKLAQAKKQFVCLGRTDEDIIALEKEFVKSVEMAKEIARGQENELLNQIIEGCLRAAKMPLTRLGRIRRQLREEGVIKNAPELAPEED